MHPLAFRPKVAVELEEAAQWYDLQKPGLGDDFLAHFWEEVNSIAEAPLRWPKYFGPVRRYVMSRFPYLIYYEVDGEIVRILRVVHASRDPEAVRRGFN